MNQTEVGGDADCKSTVCRDAMAVALLPRKDRRMAAKKGKRKQKRKVIAELARREEEDKLNDPEEQMRLQAEEEMEKQRVEKERMEFEERERRILEEWERRRRDEEEREEEERRRAEEEDERRRMENQNGSEDVADEDDEWEYVEEGPPEIIWQGNEIIVKKKRIKVKRKDVETLCIKEDPNRPTSNPFPPQSEAFDDSINGSVLSAQELIENVAHETPNFGTEQDKAHCPFHLKTGACRFGTQCSRIHFYPDKSCTLLMKNMYNGPGLAWEQDEGLECTDEEVEQAYEEFYADVHTEFLKFGEIVNFKVCRNGLPHLRGNVYVQYKYLESAVDAFQFINGRYFAGKQVLCEFVGVTRWKIAICGEFMKSRYKTCSRGISCNFIHCFRNPGGDYGWADWDKPPPRHWQRNITALFRTSDEQESSMALADNTKRSWENYDPQHDRKHSEAHYSRHRNNKSSWKEECGSKSPSIDRSRKHTKDYESRKLDFHRRDEYDKREHTKSRRSHEIVNGRSIAANHNGFEDDNKMSYHRSELKRKSDYQYYESKRERDRDSPKKSKRSKENYRRIRTEVYEANNMRDDRWEPSEGDMML